jgi:hypothetical protein
MKILMTLLLALSFAACSTTQQKIAEMQGPPKEYYDSQGKIRKFVHVKVDVDGKQEVIPMKPEDVKEWRKASPGG